VKHDIGKEVNSFKLSKDGALPNTKITLSVVFERDHSWFHVRHKADSLEGAFELIANGVALKMIEGICWFTSGQLFSKIAMDDESPEIPEPWAQTTGECGYIYKGSGSDSDLDFDECISLSMFRVRFGQPDAHIPKTYRIDIDNCDERGRLVSSLDLSVLSCTRTIVSKNRLQLLYPSADLNWDDSAEPFF
jgi:hypothetical protein